MINEVVVRILAERIARKGENPLRKRPFELDDVTNPNYRKAVEDYILEHTANVTGIEEIKEEPKEKPVEVPEENNIEKTTIDNKKESSIITQ